MQKRDSHVYPAYKLRWNQLNVLMIFNFDSLVESISDQFNFSLASCPSRGFPPPDFSYVQRSYIFLYKLL